MKVQDPKIPPDGERGDSQAVQRERPFRRGFGLFSLICRFCAKHFGFLTTKKQTEFIGLSG